MFEKTIPYQNKSTKRHFLRKITYRNNYVTINLVHLTVKVTLLVQVSINIAENNK